jgi:hypothetical protein
MQSYHIIYVCAWGLNEWIGLPKLAEVVSQAQPSQALSFHLIGPFRPGIQSSI